MSDSFVKKGQPKGDRLTELGLLPDCWDIVPLGAVFVFKNGLNKAERLFGTVSPFVNYMDVFECPGFTIDHISGRVNLSPEEIKSFQVRLRDVFFTETSETVEEVGIAYVMLDRPYGTVLSGCLLRARPRDSRLSNSYK